MAQGREGERYLLQNCLHASAQEDLYDLSGLSIYTFGTGNSNRIWNTFYGTLTVPGMAHMPMTSDNFVPSSDRQGDLKCWLTLHTSQTHTS